MKRFLFAAALAAVSITAPAFASNVDVSVSIGQPGFYGRLDIGDFPPPRVIYRQPMIVERVEVERSPIYLRVPPGHARHWKKHCREYDACGERVLFVQDHWYEREYVPRYRERYPDRRDYDRYDDRDQHRDRHDHGHGHGYGHYR